MKRLRRRMMPLLALSLAVAACGGGEGEPDDLPAADRGLPTDSVTDRTGAQADPSVPAEGDSVQRGGGPSTGPVADTGVAADWSDRPVRARPDQGAPATLTAVRSARHESYDRIVFEFSDRIPGYSVSYVDGTPRQCGSGNAVDPGGPHALSIDLRPAVAHTEAGQPTVQDRARSPDLPVLKTARLTCDFEAIVEWVVGTSQRAPVRVLELTSPARLVVDLRHR